MRSFGPVMLDKAFVNLCLQTLGALDFQWKTFVMRTKLSKSTRERIEAMTKPQLNKWLEELDVDISELNLNEAPAAFIASLERQLTLKQIGPKEAVDTLNASVRVRKPTVLLPSGGCGEACNWRPAQVQRVLSVLKT